MSEERGGGAAHRALEHFEGELMFEGEWIPPTPFNGIAFLAAGAVLRHLHRRTQARGEPRARARPKRKKTRSRAPTAPPSLTPPTFPPPIRPRLTPVPPSPPPPSLVPDRERRAEPDTARAAQARQRTGPSMGPSPNITRRRRRHSWRRGERSPSGSERRRRSSLRVRGRRDGSARFQRRRWTSSDRPGDRSGDASGGGDARGAPEASRRGAGGAARTESLH